MTILSFHEQNRLQKLHFEKYFSHPGKKYLLRSNPYERLLLNQKYLGVCGMETISRSVVDETLVTE